MRRISKEFKFDEKPNQDNLLNKIHTKDSLKFMKRLPDKSIDLCMTSPPYWQMRDYGITGQIGQEKTSEEYIEKLVTIFGELKRILKDTGSFYLNMGDTYIGTDNYRRKSWKMVKQLALIPSSSFSPVPVFL